MVMHEFDAREVERLAHGQQLEPYAARMLALLLRWAQDGPEELDDNRTDTVALLLEMAREWRGE